MLWIQTLLLPLVIVLNALGNAVLRTARHQPPGAHNADQYYTSEELQLIVEESRSRARFATDAGRMLQELFEFGELTAGEVMVPRVRITGIPVGARPRRSAHDSRPDAAHAVSDLSKAISITSSARYHIKDLLRLLLDGQRASPRPTRGRRRVVPETALLDAVLATMRTERAQIAIVIDEHGGTSGLVTLEDLFEEVVGEIDEGPGAARGPRRDAAGRAARARAPCGSTISGQLFDLELAHEDVDSVSGLILTLLGRPPQCRRCRPLRAAPARGDGDPGPRRRRAARSRIAEPPATS